MAIGGSPWFDVEPDGDEKTARDVQYDELPFKGRNRTPHSWKLRHKVDQMAGEIKHLRDETHT